MIELNQNDFKILQKLINKDGRGMSKITGLTKKQLCEETSLSMTKIKDATKTLLALGYIAEGIMKVRAKTYYITSSGIEELREVKKQVTKK